ncbi:hypothetical protein [Halocatena halophila]|uniref:hypothetical protein n=1 Tax=Halocatena halophila TaxID=2814576 RepID=UPI002ED10211
MTDGFSTVVQQIDELERHYREKQHEAAGEGDDVGGAYFAGHVSALIRVRKLIGDTDD